MDKVEQDYPRLPHWMDKIDIQNSQFKLLDFWPDHLLCRHKSVSPYYGSIQTSEIEKLIRLSDFCPISDLKSS